ncbi:glycosyl hydrolase family 15 [Aureimonas sp. Leaf454]|uniref:glycoside hydrolase family 15 protein n=1 Tax=Aureimonas sp. Leaf454 TaxID=1736381 RepID=UPI0006F695F5|nr:glycoside hydrolase family 15 protein [Aureimonas sp. Leaf454]KQT54423.1 glycosyl hydrolase family 15 [Aureimonas sp. Leaf454]
MPAAEAKPTTTPIADHGVIGDMRTLALVAVDGTIDYFCHPNIDSPSIFAGLLDAEKGGCFRFGVRDASMRHKQIYLPDTNILITRFLGANGIAEVSDFMPIDGSGRIVRRAKAIVGEMVFDLSLAPRPDYGRIVPDLAHIEGGVRISWPGADPLYFYTSAPVTIEAGTVTASVRLAEGDTCHAVLCPGRNDQISVDERYVQDAFTQTRTFWHDWVAAGTYPTYRRDLVIRSALTLKLLTSKEHGSIAAAGTFGLPEVLGGERNWDYRFTWVRDSAFTLYAFSRLGYFDEAEDFTHFLMEHALSGGEPHLQIMYGMDGSTELPEISLDHLAGYADSRPVRIGNGAFDQRQMDIYGEFMDALYIASRARGKPSHAVWSTISRIIEWLADNWGLPDHGIWESRGEPREYLSSRLMCWVAFDRALRMAIRHSLPAPIERWRTERDKIQATLLEEFWNPEIGAFTQYKGGRGLDAVVLLMPLVKFINPRDPLWISTLAAVKRELVHDCLVHRYVNLEENSDGLEGEEGSFTICSFWYVEALARSGQVSEARFLFEKLHSYANHLGLYSEELSSTGDHLGNFPQGLTHLSLISAAIWLDRALNGDRSDPAFHQHHQTEDPDGVF